MMIEQIVNVPISQVSSREPIRVTPETSWVRSST